MVPPDFRATVGDMQHCISSSISLDEKSPFLGDGGFDDMCASCLKQILALVQALTTRWVKGASRPPNSPLCVIRVKKGFQVRPEA
jgi:hypothetical protein